MTAQNYTYLLRMPDGSDVRQSFCCEPYVVFELRRTGNFIYNYWSFKTPSGAHKKYRALQEWLIDMSKYPNYNAGEVTYALASPLELD